mgnify:CR=1 FL=1|jgi:hypothetical protein
MQTAVFEPQTLVSPDVRISCQFPLAKEEKNEKKLDLFRSLTDKGLDRLTATKIEHILCTSALSAHI